MSQTAPASIRQQNCLGAEPSSNASDCASAWNRSGVERQSALLTKLWTAAAGILWIVPPAAPC
jgi:hypothetical protein